MLKDSKNQFIQISSDSKDDIIKWLNKICEFCELNEINHQLIKKSSFLEINKNINDKISNKLYNANSITSNAKMYVGSFDLKNDQECNKNIDNIIKESTCDSYISNTSEFFQNRLLNKLTNEIQEDKYLYLNQFKSIYDANMCDYKKANIFFDDLDLKKQNFVIKTEVNIFLNNFMKKA